MQNTCRYMVQDMADIADVDRVSGVGATLIANHCIDITGQDIDDLALALVSSVQSDNTDVLHPDSPVPIERQQHLPTSTRLFRPCKEPAPREFELSHRLSGDSQESRSIPSVSQ